MIILLSSTHTATTEQKNLYKSLYSVWATITHMPFILGNIVHRFRTKQCYKRWRSTSTRDAGARKGRKDEIQKFVAMVWTIIWTGTNTVQVLSLKGVQNSMWFWVIPSNTWHTGFMICFHKSENPLWLGGDIWLSRHAHIIVRVWYQTNIPVLPSYYDTLP